MRLITTIILLSFFCGCNEVELPTRIHDSIQMEVPDVNFAKDEVEFDKTNSLWVHPENSNKVSGYIVSYYANGSVAQKFGVVDGKKEGESITYFPSGQVKFLESFKGNRLHGEVKRWTEENDHQLVAQLHYENGKLQGEQRKWYPTGELHKLLNLRNGKEEGMQQAFRKNGALYANYEARNGRVFGMKRSNLCYELDNEKVVYNK
jgi:antitoxin component YwqK of YwqJK toxin-antitoxin module